MKALKSERAKRLLADPKARSQLRNANTGSWVVQDRTGRVMPMDGGTIVLRDRDDKVIDRLTPTIVPKAA